MPQYDFIARDRLGKAEKGTVEAQNPDEAVSVLQSRNLVVISVTEHQGGVPEVALLRRRRRLHTRVRSNDLIVFARSLAAMVEAGLPLLRVMEVVEGQTLSSRLRGAIHQMIRDVRGGSTFRDAVAKHPAIFSSLWVSLVETGEASGQLAQSLEQIVSYLEKSTNVQRKVISALIYPSILLCVAIIAVLIFTLKIVPSFASLFSGFGARLPALTQAVISFSGWFRRLFPALLAGAVLIWFLAFRYIRTKPGRWQFDRLKLQLPLFGPLFQEVAAEQFASNLGTLLKAGVPILHALEIVISTCGNQVVASVLEHVRTAVREGRPLAEPMGQTDIFPPMVTQMVAVGEQTGKLSSMLDEVSKYYQGQISTTLERMTALLEPIMLIGIALVIGLLVVSMYLRGSPIVG
ncbi:MAG: type II secretion system F family protein [Candidatus Omnitrophica bacterium]|nr:type II secretion system F family protein [Candidatus Omnitrophota bacterium]